MRRLKTIAGTIPALARTLLAGTDTERCAIGYAHHSAAAGDWILAEVQPVEEDAYAGRDAVSASLHGRVLVDVANRVRRDGMTPVFIHTHPFAKGTPRFSGTDDRGETEILEYLSRRAPEVEALAMVVGPDGLRARVLGDVTPVEIWDVGPKVSLLGAENDVPHHERNDRQVRAFGEAGQNAIGRVRFLVVGAGGTGSAVLQQLAYLGAAHVTVMDPDRVETTNLNRLVGATPGDVGRPKAEVARDMFVAVSPHAHVQAIVGDIVDAGQARRIADHDVVMLCTDSHASRAVVGQAAYQYLVPAIDMGVSITVSEGQVTHLTGRVQMLAPGLPCLSCTGALDGEQIRREMLTPEQRAADPYIIGGHAPQPSVITLNSTMASLATTMLLGALTPIPAKARFQYYDGIRGTVRPTSALQRENCIVCSTAGALGRGASWDLPVRPEAGQ
jgi:molybdopterin/thiamine biosynthesis adenylyltransferase